MQKTTKNVGIRIATALAICLTLPVPASAQWLKIKTPGIPRTPDGKPDLTAPAPKTADGKPDLSGLWRSDTAGEAATGKALDTVKPQLWAAKLKAKRMENFGSDGPSVLCLPPGPDLTFGVGKIVQTPNLILMLYNGTYYRDIFMDGRSLPEDPNPTWMGYSIGHWDGDALVISSAGFNDRSWLDDDGLPHTEALRVTERLRRPDFGHLEMTRTFTDSGALLEPFTIPMKFELNADTEQLEYVCNENERDRVHLVGKVSDDKSVKVDAALLSKYAGAYQAKDPTNGRPIDFTFTVDGDHLVISGVGPTTPVLAVSQTEFSVFGTGSKFSVDASGAVTDVLMQSVEGDLKAVRK